MCGSFELDVAGVEFQLDNPRGDVEGEHAEAAAIVLLTAMLCVEIVVADVLDRLVQRLLRHDRIIVAEFRTVNGDFACGQGDAGIALVDRDIGDSAAVTLAVKIGADGRDAGGGERVEHGRLVGLPERVNDFDTSGFDI